MSECSESDEPDWMDIVAEKFGTQDLIAAVRNPARLQQLLDTGTKISADALIASCYIASAKSLKVLLAAGADPNERLGPAKLNDEKVADGWSSKDVSVNFGLNKRMWYPLHYAAMNHQYAIETKERRESVIGLLIDHGANLYATFVQPLWHPKPFPCPGDGGLSRIDHLNTTTHSYDDSNKHEGWDAKVAFDAESQKFPTPEQGYGIRCVLHALVEDGAYVKTIISSSSIQVDVEHRDPQGRTLIHSVCRNCVGADSVIDAMESDAHRTSRHELTAAEDSEDSLFHIVRKKNANLLARDDSGRTILHHLLEARSSATDRARPPFIHNTISWVLGTLRELVNVRDYHGNSPLHKSLQRLVWYDRVYAYTYDLPVQQMVHDLCDAGADLTAQDSRGNTALHYLAARGLAGVGDLYRRFCESGLDVNARNKSRKTALEILMANTCRRNEDQWSLHYAKSNPPTQNKVEAEILEMFDKAGVDWTAQDWKGRTLLHHAAEHAALTTGSRLRILIGYGVDPMIKDTDGRTALDVALLAENTWAMEDLNRLVRQGN